MTLFRPPSYPYYTSEDFRWEDNPQPDLCNPHLLWEDYWRRFNTIQMPVLPPDEFLERAAAISRVAKNRQDFEKLFAQWNKQQQEKLEALFTTARLKSLSKDNIFPCEDAARTAFLVGGTGCLLNFIRLLQGVVLGWEADEVDEDDVAPDGSTKDTNSIPDEEIQSYIDAQLNECINKYSHTHSNFDLDPPSHPQRPENTLRKAHMEPVVGEEQETNSTHATEEAYSFPLEELPDYTQHVDDYWYTESFDFFPPDNLCKTYVESVTGEEQEVNSTCCATDTPKQSPEFSTETQNRSKKRVRFSTTDAEELTTTTGFPTEAQDRPQKRVRLSITDAEELTTTMGFPTETQDRSQKRVRLSTTDAEELTTTMGFPTETQDRPQKRVRLSTTDAEELTTTTGFPTEAQDRSQKRARSSEDDFARTRKRRKIENPSWEEPDIPTAQSADESSTREEGFRNEENNPLGKRQGLQKQTRHTSAQHMPVSTQTVTDGRVSKKKSKHGRKKGHQQNFFPSAPSTRSTRGRSSPLLMELDNGGRPRVLHAV